MHRAIVRGKKDKSINIYPLIKKFESDRKIKPVNNDIKHNINLKVFVLFI